MKMICLHCFCTQCMPKALKISGKLYSRKKPPYEGRLSVTQHNTAQHNSGLNVGSASESSNIKVRLTSMWEQIWHKQHQSSVAISCSFFLVQSHGWGRSRERDDFWHSGPPNCICWWLCKVASDYSSSGTALSVCKGPFFPSSKQCLSHQVGQQILPKSLTEICRGLSSWDFVLKQLCHVIHCPPTPIFCSLFLTS